MKKEEAGICVRVPIGELLENSFLLERNHNAKMSRLGYLADHIFDFTTYDAEMSEVFAGKAIEVCAAITEKHIFDYIQDADNYRWFLLMVNMPFFAGRLDWGASIRGAWWDEDQVLESCGIWCGDEQVLSMKFSSGEWPNFIRELVAFSRREV